MWSNLIIGVDPLQGGNHRNWYRCFWIRKRRQVLDIICPIFSLIDRMHIIMVWVLSIRNWRHNNNGSIRVGFSRISVNNRGIGYVGINGRGQCQGWCQLHCQWWALDMFFPIFCVNTNTISSIIVGWWWRWYEGLIVLIWFILRNNFQRRQRQWYSIQRRRHSWRGYQNRNPLIFPKQNPQLPPQPSSGKMGLLLTSM